MAEVIRLSADISIMQTPAAVGDKRKHGDALGDDDAQATARARAFLTDFKALPLDKLSLDEGKAQAEQLYQALLSDAEELPPLKRLLTAAA